MKMQLSEWITIKKELVVTKTKEYSDPPRKYRVYKIVPTIFAFIWGFIKQLNRKIKENEWKWKNRKSSDYVKASMIWNIMFLFSIFWNSWDFRASIADAHISARGCPCLSSWKREFVFMNIAKDANPVAEKKEWLKTNWWQISPSCFFLSLSFSSIFAPLVMACIIWTCQILQIEKVTWW